MEPSEDELFHERQHLLLCGVHAVNNILGSKVFAKADFDAIADDLASQPEVQGSGGWFNPHRSKLRLGDFDENIIAVALQKHGLDCVPSFGSSNACGLVRAVGSVPSSPMDTLTVDHTTNPPSIRYPQQQQQQQHEQSSSNGTAPSNTAVTKPRVVTMTRSLPVQWIPAPVQHPPASGSGGSGGEGHKEREPEDGELLQVPPFLVSLQIQSCDGALQSPVKLSDGSSFKNPLDLWTPFGFIVNAQQSHMLGLWKSRHWFAVKRQQGRGRREGGGGGGGGGGSSDFFNLDSNFESPERFDSDIACLNFLMSFPDLRVIRP
jgi:hypothetical protein